MIRQSMPGWERVVRVAAGAAVIAYGVLRAKGVPMELLLVCSGALLAGTGLVRFCPACAIVGRQ